MTFLTAPVDFGPGGKAHLDRIGRVRLLGRIDTDFSVPFVVESPATTDRRQPFVLAGQGLNIGENANHHVGIEHP